MIGRPGRLLQEAVRSKQTRAAAASIPMWSTFGLQRITASLSKADRAGVHRRVNNRRRRAAGTFEPSVVEGRFMIHVPRNNRPWIVIVEPDTEASLLVVVTVYEVSE